MEIIILGNFLRRQTVGEPEVETAPFLGSKRVRYDDASGIDINAIDELRKMKGHRCSSVNVYEAKDFVPVTFDDALRGQDPKNYLGSL